MANRRYNQFAHSLEVSKVFLYMRFTVGATGAPTLDSKNSKGFASISRTGVGSYTVTLSDTYNRLMACEFISVFATPAAINMFMPTEAVNTVGNPNFTIKFVSAAGTPVELANGEDIRIEVILKNSNV